MTTLLIALGVLIVGVAVLMQTTGRFGGGSTTRDLGSVSHGWLAEHRLGRKDDMR